MTPVQATPVLRRARVLRHLQASLNMQQQPPRQEVSSTLSQMTQMMKRMEAAARRAEEPAERTSKCSAYKSCDEEANVQPGQQQQFQQQQQEQQPQQDQQQPHILPSTSANVAQHTKEQSR